MFQQITSIAMKGFMLNNAPLIARGMLIEVLKQYKITTQVVIELVKYDQSLWLMLDPAHYGNVQKAIARVGNTEWLTTDWLIDAVRKDMPALASLFMSWPEAYDWLERQVAEVKKETS